MQAFVPQLIIVLAMISTTWKASRNRGLLGLVGAHCLCGFGWLAAAMFSFWSGIWREYDGVIDLLTILVQAIALNSILLPLGLWGMECWRREAMTTWAERETA